MNYPKLEYRIRRALKNYRNYPATGRETLEAIDKALGDETGRGYELSSKEVMKMESGFGGSLLPALLKALSELIEDEQNLAELEFVFDSVEEELRVTKFEGDGPEKIVCTMPY